MIPMGEKKELLEAYCEICRKSKSVMEVGPERYRLMADISDSEIEELLVALTFANAETINRMVFSDKPAKSDQDLIDFMEMMLHFLSVGYVAINPNGDLGCVAPEGPSPTDEKNLALDRRIRSAFPIIPIAMMRAMNGGKKLSEFEIPFNFRSRI